MEIYTEGVLGELHGAHFFWDSVLFHRDLSIRIYPHTSSKISITNFLIMLLPNSCLPIRTVICLQLIIIDASISDYISLQKTVKKT